VWMDGHVKINLQPVFCVLPMLGRID